MDRIVLWGRLALWRYESGEGIRGEGEAKGKGSKG